MRRNPRRDLLAGLTVAIVALPLALAFGVASGLGAQAGLATAVIAGIVAAVFGGSNVQISGPTGAMTVALVPVVHHHGRAGVLLVALMAGLVLIAVVIALQQLPAALGIENPAGGPPSRSHSSVWPWRP